LTTAWRHIIWYGALKFAAGLVVGFMLGIFLPILTAEKGLNEQSLAARQNSAERIGVLRVIWPDRTGFTGAMGRSW
jgi:hypothetical protein